MVRMNLLLGHEYYGFICIGRQFCKTKGLDYTGGLQKAFDSIIVKKLKVYESSKNVTSDSKL